MAHGLLIRLSVIVVALLSSVAVPFDSTDNTTSVATVWVTDIVTSIGSPSSATAISPSGLVTSLLLLPGSPQGPVLPISLATSIAPSQTALLASSNSTLPLPASTVVVTDVTTNIVTATLTEPPATVTVAAPPQTVTEVVTVSPLPPAPTPQTAWKAPAQMTDLAAFNVTNFASGQQNLHIVNGIPVDISVVTLDVMADAAAINNVTMSNTAPLWDNSSAVLQLFYPANSINPASEPQGGADFYATPLELHEAQSVSLEYSVFFPVDFDWVQGGKLPGIYGGHTGCSGGDAAVTCFSTRLMWRAGGAGELYLYAPKDKQTTALCETPPMSVCDAAYGLSIGRGSFNFTPGAWTHVRQTVSLNTPGQQDGGFLLEVNGQQTINRTDVYYRDALAPPQQSGPGDDGSDDGDDDDDNDGDDGDDGSDDSSDDSGDDGSLGDLLGNLLVRVAFWPAGGILVLRDDPDSLEPALLPSPTFAELPVTDAAASAILAGFMSITPTVTLVQDTSAIMSTSTTTDTSPLTQTTTPTATTTTTLYPSAVPTNLLMEIAEAQNPEPVRFTGLFFSTFFGGHEPEYATPKDQYAWFKDFSMTINS